MGLSVRDAERLADEMYRDRRISGAVFCGRCGYCLKTLPYQYSCPECGQEYNARPVVMHGVYMPIEGEMPVEDVLLTLFCAGGSVALHWGAYSPLDSVRVGMAVILSLFGLLYALHTFRRFMRALRSRAITRRIRREGEV